MPPPVSVDLPTKDAPEHQEDAVIYTIYFPSRDLPETHSFQWLCDKARQAYSHLAPYIASHLWQVQDLSLEPLVRPGVNALTGECRFGDSILDEWLIVWCLYEISNLFPDVYISVQDKTDGEILLIEAADHLPDSLTPSNSANRVFIHQGSLHILPLSLGPSHLASKYPPEDTLHGLSLHTALSYLFSPSPSPSTIASSSIQQAISKRLEPYPQILVQHTHHAKVALPRRVASLLHTHPTLISPITLAFHYRDLREDRPVSPIPPEDLVIVSTRMTRILYAQLQSQPFSTPPSWSPLLPSPKDPSYDAYSLGMKLTCGLEMLMTHAPAEELQGTMVPEPIEESDPTWKDMLHTLESKGYFQQKDPGSEEWEQLKRLARSYMTHHGLQTGSSVSREKKGGEKERAACLAIHALDQPPLPSSVLEANTLEDDPTSWYFLDQAGLDKEVQGVMGSSAPTKGMNLEDLMEDEDTEEEEEEDGRDEREGAQKLDKAVESFTHFIHQESSLDGVVFPGEKGDEEDKDEEEEEEGEDEGWEEEEEEGEDEGWEEEEEDDHPHDETSHHDQSQREIQVDQVMKSLEQLLGMHEDKEKAPEMEDSEDQEEASIEELTQAMEAELSKTTLGRSFHQQESTSSSTTLTNPLITGEEEDEESRNRINLAHQMLSSIQAQQGLSGPLSAMLGRMGLELPGSPSSTTSTTSANPPDQTKSHDGVDSKEDRDRMRNPSGK